MNDQILELLEKFSSLDIQELKFESKEFKLELSKGREKNSYQEVLSSATEKPIIEKSISNPSREAEIAEDISKIEQIKSPMVGIYYSRMNPEAEKLAEVGDTVKEGQVVCIIEAMKMFNEIVSPCDGIISKCNFKDGEMVAYDETIFEVERND